MSDFKKHWEASEKIAMQISGSQDSEHAVAL
jgi:hypothetical protein